MNNAIGRVTSILSIPYGYTVSLRAAGALTVRRLGPPSVFDVLLFVNSFLATAAYILSLAGLVRVTRGVRDGGQVRQVGSER